MQWCIINIKMEKNFGQYTNFGECHALEIFNDFTYSDSYAPESSDTCYNGTLIPGKYIYWFNTYPLEYAEFLLDSALARGVYLHTLTSNDAFFKKVCEFDPEMDPNAEGINNVFEYSAKHQCVPFVIKNQPNPKRMCHLIDETKDMELVYTFAKCKNIVSRSRLIWRYTIMYETEDKTALETAHGYFKLQAEGKTILNLSDSYDLKTVKWLYFVVIDPVNPMRRAWFNAIKGPAFGMPEIVQTPEVEPVITSTAVNGVLRALFGQERGRQLADIGNKFVEAGGAYLRGNQPDDQSCYLPELKHRVFYTKSSSNEKRDIIQDVEFHPEEYKSDELEFMFPKSTTGNEDICVYFLQVCPHVQDITIPNKTANSYKTRPPRILQSVHGFYLMHPEYPTKLKLSNSWDKDTVKDGKVYFYDISAATGQPLNPE